MSKLTKLTINNAAEFDSALKANVGKPGGKLFVLFTGEKDASGTSWCPDCNDAAPLISSVMQEAAGEADGGVVMLEVPLVRSEYKGNDKHWARVHPQAKLQRIPTLMKWGMKGKVGELIEDQCKDSGLVKELCLE